LSIRTEVMIHFPITGDLSAIRKWGRAIKFRSGRQTPRDGHVHIEVRL
jgi:hypothetical protein